MRGQPLGTRIHATAIEGLLIVIALEASLWGAARWAGPVSDVDAAPMPSTAAACQVLWEDRPLPWRPVLFDGAFRDAPWSVDGEIDRWTRMFIGSFRPTFRAFLGRAARYEAQIREVLREHGIPEDFLYLAVIESGMDPHAYSRARAVGMWQFMSFTARSRGLEVGWTVDERRDPVAATDAAARHLEDLYATFGDWALAAAAYNAGEYRVKRALRRAGGSAGYWELSRRGLLPPETRDYVPKLIAAARVGHDPRGTGLGFVPREQPLEWTDVEVEPASRLDAIARAAALTRDRLLFLNPHLRQGITSPWGTTSSVRLPVDAVARFEVRWALMPASDRRGSVVHVVQRRETLSGIAEVYGISLDALRHLNEVEPRRLMPGQRLTVPLGTL